MKWKERLRNKAFWVSAAALITLLAKTFGFFQIPSDFDALLNTGLGLLVTIGVLIDPTTPGITDK